VPDFDPIVKSRRYILGETEEYYGIWDKRGGDEPLEGSPLSTEGFDAAEHRFRELLRADRADRGSLPSILWPAVVIGALLWVLAGVIATAFGVIAALSPESAQGFFTGAQVAGVADTLGFRLAVGAFFILTGLVFVRWERRTRPSSDDDPNPPATGGFRPISVLSWIMGSGLGLWILSAIATKILEPQLFGPPPFGAGGPPTALIVAEVVEAVSLRAWVAALILQAVGFVRAAIRTRDTKRLED
jgi:hypothetical protein